MLGLVQPLVDPTPGTLAAFTTSATALLTSLLSMVSSIITTITGNDYLLYGFLVVIISFAIGILVRIVSKLGHAAR